MNERSLAKYERNRHLCLHLGKYTENARQPSASENRSAVAEDKGRGKEALQEDGKLWVVTQVFDALTSQVGVCVGGVQTHSIVHFKYVKFIIYTVYLKKALKKKRMLYQTK